MTGETGRQDHHQGCRERGGVSVVAVSKVLRNAYGVSPALRTRMQAAMDHPGYRPNLAARGMRGQSLQIPLACLGHHEPQTLGFDTVNSDDLAGARLVVKAMLARGHRDIGMISLDPGVDHIVLAKVRKIGPAGTGWGTIASNGL